MIMIRRVSGGSLRVLDLGLYGLIGPAGPLMMMMGSL